MVLGTAAKCSKKTRHGTAHSSSSATLASCNAAALSRGLIAGTSSSKRVHRFSAAVSRVTGLTESATTTHNPTAILREQALEAREYTTRIKAMSVSWQRAELHATTLFDDGYDPMRSPSPDGIDMNDVLSSETVLDLSHAGGEFAELLAIEEDVLGPPTWRARGRTHDYRTRRDRTQRRMEGFAWQMSSIVDMYMAWMLEMGDKPYIGDYMSPPEAIVQGTSRIKVLNMFQTYTATIQHIEGDAFVNVALIRHGLIPCSPFTLTAAFTVRTLEFYQVLHNRSPGLSIHAFIQSLCDQHSAPFKPYISRQFSICFDLYLEIRTTTDKCVQAALRRNTKDYCLRHNCPSCTYKLINEPHLEFSMLYTVDGNDSLKHIIRRENVPETASSDGAFRPVVGASSELTDTRIGGEEVYLTNEYVNKWSKESIAAIDPTYNEDEDDGNPCAEWWRNMKSTITSKMWGVFDETGIFLALRRHGFVLMIADMVRSGELSKYPLAMVEKMLEVFGRDLGGGYDIACRFWATLYNSPLGPKARENNYRTLVGAFHGHAHNRLCQSKNLSIYVDGMGLKDLEGNERYFACSNLLAASVRHASTFHRCQAIANHAVYTDTFKTYQNLSTFLLNNYKQALGILDTKPMVVAALANLGADNPEVVKKWLREEEEYLRGLSKEPLEETLQMEYYKLLVNLQNSEQTLSAATAVWSSLTPQTITDRDLTRATETTRRHALESNVKDLEAVQGMEKNLSILQRWTSECKEWKAAADKVRMRLYQRCIDTLEGLVVARMFELTKMNMSQTGYNLRKHISAALKSRSSAIRTALNKYNAAALDLSPCRPTLDWDQVVEYAFLANFDLLRDTQQDIRSRPWATPAARLAMDSYFKVLRAEEEIVRLNVEIPRLATYIRDEKVYMSPKEIELALTDPALANRIRLHRMQRGRFDKHHNTILQQIVTLPGYSGGPLLGTRARDVTPAVEQSPTLTTKQAPANDTVMDDNEEELAAEQAGEDREEDLIGAFYHVLKMSADGTSLVSI